MGRLLKAFRQSERGFLLSRPFFWPVIVGTALCPWMEKLLHCIFICSRVGWVVVGVVANGLAIFHVKRKMADGS